jgi:hypothetical protein
MKNRILAGLTVAGVAILASCGQDLSQSTAVPSAASYARVVTPTCSYSTATNDARAYFSSNKDNVFTLLSAMSKVGSGAVANSAGWSVIGRLAEAVGTAAVKGTPAQGSAFANDVLLCMAVSTYAYPLDLSGALGANGLFAVRDGSGATPLAVVSRGTPVYGAEPTTTAWPVASSTLFYGSPVNSSLFDNETPAGVVFDLKSLPGSLTFSSMIRVGVCSITDPNARILHDHTGATPVILSPDVALSFCPTASNATQSSNSLFAAAASLATWLAPQPAHAATMMFRLGGGGTGLVGGLSDIGPVSFTSVVKFAVKPTNTSVSKTTQWNPTVTVTDSTAKNHPIANVLITLSVTSNNGSFNISGNTAYTNADGVATFPDLHIDKAGGYTMTATSEVGGSTSVFFNINGQ